MRPMCAIPCDGVDEYSGQAGRIDQDNQAFIIRIRIDIVRVRIIFRIIIIIIIIIIAADDIST